MNQICDPLVFVTIVPTIDVQWQMRGVVVSNFKCVHVTSQKFTFKKITRIKNYFQIYFKNYKSFELYSISTQFIFIHPSYPSSNISCTTWHEHRMSATHLSCSLALPDTRQRRVRWPHHHQCRSALAPGPLAERTRSHAHHDMRALPFAFSRASFAVQKDSKPQRTTRHHLCFSRINNSKYQQAYMQENITVHLHEYWSHACMHVCMTSMHWPFACTCMQEHGD